MALVIVEPADGAAAASAGASAGCEKASCRRDSSRRQAIANLFNFRSEEDRRSVR